MPDSEKQATTESFLPDFCSLQTLLSVLIISELLALVLMLGNWSGGRFAWEVLGVLSLFIVWVVLVSLGLMCSLRKRLARMNVAMASLGCYLIIMLVTLLVSELTWWLNQYVFVKQEVSHAGFTARNLIVTTIVSGIVLRVIYLQHQRKVYIEARARARVEALVARMRPHFLFNSMNTIASLIPVRPADAEQAVEDLADLFRISLQNDATLVDVDDEISHVKKYLELESLRLGDRLKVQWNLAELPSGLRLPPLCLQPLVENAIYHGIEPLPEGGTVSIAATSDAGCAGISISNPVATAAGSRHKGHHIAQENIRERLAHLFNGRARLESYEANNVYTVILTVPLKEPEHENTRL